MSTPKDVPAARGIARLLALAVDARNVGYDAGLLPVRQVAGLAVISIGNLRAGGSGKSPLAGYLAALLAGRGHRVALLARGYRGGLEAAGGAVSRGDGLLVGAAEAGDEAYVAARRLRGIAVRVGADRVAQARAARTEGAEVAVLDDGFQHRRLHRELDLLIAAPADLDPATRLLPAGPLREGAAAAARADLVCGFAPDWQEQDAAPPVLFGYRAIALVEPNWDTVPLTAGRGAGVQLLSGIARPERFVRTARLAGFEVIDHAEFADHHRFTASELAAVAGRAKANGAELILTTEKDLARIDAPPAGPPLLALRIDVEIEAGAALLAQHLDEAISSAASARRAR